MIDFPVPTGVGSTFTVAGGATYTWDGTAWIIAASNDPSGINPVPAGTILFLSGNAAPTGYLKANGAAISRATYATLFTAIGTTYGTGDGSTTFNIPDMRGEFARGFDDGRGVDASRALGSYQDDQYQDHTHTLTHDRSGTVNATDVPRIGTGSSTTLYTNGSRAGVGYRYGSETRPRNRAFLAVIKY
jgi:microcystin-dependent protein